MLCELLGIAAANRAWIAVTVAAYDERAEHQRVERELGAYFTELTAAKRAEPGDDLVSALTLACDNADGAADGLTGNELVSTIFLLVMAGFDTTVNLIASGALALLTHPGEKTRLRQDPSLLPAAVEDLLRFTSLVNHTNDRFTTQDVRVGDVVIPAGEWVLPVISSANRDLAQFADPDRPDHGRDTSGHVAFGHGVHPVLAISAEIGHTRGDRAHTVGSATSRAGGGRLLPGRMSLGEPGKFCEEIREAVSDRGGGVRSRGEAARKGRHQGEGQRS